MLDLSPELVALVCVVLLCHFNDLLLFESLESLLHGDVVLGFPDSLVKGLVRHLDGTFLRITGIEMSHLAMLLPILLAQSVLLCLDHSELGFQLAKGYLSILWIVQFSTSWVHDARRNILVGFVNP